MVRDSEGITRMGSMPGQLPLSGLIRAIRGQKIRGSSVAAAPRQVHSWFNCMDTANSMNQGPFDGVRASPNRRSARPQPAVCISGDGRLT